MGVTGFFGNSASSPGYAGGEFSTTATSPGGVAVNDASGDVYVVDRGNHRVQRFDSDGAFLSAWGTDVIPGGATGTGNLSPTTEPTVVTALVATDKAFLVGQEITGAGIQPGTRITAVSVGTGIDSTLTLSKPVTAEGTAVPLSVATGAGNVPVNEQQTATLGANTTGGTFTLNLPATQGFSTTSTAAIPFDASPNVGAASVQARLEALAPVGAGNVVVSSPNPGGGAVPGGPYTIEFVGSRADTNMPSLTSTATGLTVSSGTKSVPMATTVEGNSGSEICGVATACKPGVAIAALAPGGSLNLPQGIAVNQSSGEVYVSNQDLRRIEQFDAEGHFIRTWGASVVASGPDNVPANEVQTVTINGGPTGGTFTLSWNPGTGAQTTAAIAFNASAVDVESALEGLAALDPPDISVTSTNPGGGTAAGGPYVVEFTGAQADKDVAQLGQSAAGLEPQPGKTVAVATILIGTRAFEVCTAASVCKVGTLPNGTAKGVGFENFVGYPAVAPDGAPNAGNVMIGDGNRRVQEFNSAGAFVRTFGWDVVASGPSDAGTGFEICRAAVATDVCKAGTAGSGAGQFNSFELKSAPTRIAEDTAGNIYTLEGAANFRVQKFTPAPGEGLTPSLFNPQITPPSTPSGEGSVQFPLSGEDIVGLDSPTEIAIDPGNDHVYVVKACTEAHCPGATVSTERRIYEFKPGDPTSEDLLVETHLAGYGITSANGLGLKAGGKPSYLTSTSPRPGVSVVDDPIPPAVTIAASTAVTEEAATLNGTVNPNGGEPLHTFYRFEYSADGGSTWLKAPATDIDIGGGEAPVPVSQTVHGLQPNRNYQVRLVATKGGNPTFSTGSAGDFKTDPAPPRVETFAAFWDSSSGELVLRAGINPNNTATTYRFEYGSEPCASSTCALTPDASAGAGGAFKEVGARVADLAPETTYHFRVIAENGVGSPTVGAEETLTTPPDQPCVNEAFRIGPSAQLPECRAYEWVSNGDSWGSGITALVGSIADSGERAQFFAQAFGQPQSVPGVSTPYVAERTGSGWSVVPMVPDPDRAQGTFKAEEFMSATDLGTVLWPQATFGERLRAQVRWGLVGRDGSIDEALGPLAPLQSNSATTIGSDYLISGGAADLSSFAFVFASAEASVVFSLLPGEPVMTGQRSNLYEVSGVGPGPGTLGIVNRGGAVSSENPLGLIGGACGAGPGATVTQKSDRATASTARAISADGSVTYFSARPGEALEGNCLSSAPKRLYKRVDHTTTVAVSEAQCSPIPACPGPGGDDLYQSASRDGEVVFFTTPRRLTNSDGDDTADLYLYDSSPPASEPSLVQASAGDVAPGHPTPGSGAEVLGVLDSSIDGSRVYFVAKGVLSGTNGDGATPSPAEPNLYVYERDDDNPSGRIAFLGTLSQAVDAPQWASGETGSGSSQALPRQGADADGHLFLFVSGAPLLAEDLDAARDLYRYDDTSGQMRCLSCMGQEEGADVRIAARPNSSSRGDYLQRARPASEDGSSVVFITEESLVEEDLNGVSDVYLWRNGVLGLLSAGAGADGVRDGSTQQSIDSGISPDGKSVFFITRAPLVGADANNGLDLYAARIGGGFAEALEVPECADDEGCHGPVPSAPPPSGGVGSEAAGSGNPPTKKPCPKGKVRRGGKCVPKPRPQKKKKGQRKRGGHERGGKR